MRQQEKFIELIVENENIIHKVIHLYRVLDTDKKDLCQEILLQAWKSFGSFKEKSKFSTWLYKVALNTVLTFNRKSKNEESITLLDLNSSVENQPSKELSEVLYYVIKHLAEVDRMIILLHLDGYKNAEISEITGMTINHTTVKIHRLKKKILEHLKVIIDEDI